MFANAMNVTSGERELRFPGSVFPFGSLDASDSPTFMIASHRPGPHAFACPWHYGYNEGL